MRATINDLKLELWLRRRNNDNLFWKTMNGEEISIRNMSTEHLINTVKLFETFYTGDDIMDCISEIEDAGDRQ